MAGDPVKVGSLRKRLAQQPIGVLIRSPLAGAERIAEIGRGTQRLAHASMVCELKAIVGSQRLHSPANTAELADDCLGSWLRFQLREPVSKEVAAAPLPPLSG